MANVGDTVIPVGYVRRAHGIRGDVVVRGLVQDAAERLIPGASYDTDQDAPARLTVRAVEPLGSDLRVRFVDVDDRDAAEALRGVQLVTDASERRELAADEWWPEDLVGCGVVDRSGSSVGEVVEAIAAGAQDRLVVVRADGARAEIPFVEALVPSVDVVNRSITVDIPDGLFTDPR